MRPRHRLAALICLLSAGLTGCTHAPSTEIVGTFFPVWMVCLSVAVILTFFARKLLLRWELEPHVGSVALFYPSLVISISCLLWLVLFR